MFGKSTKKKELIKNLGQIYDQIQKEQKISPGDFPDLKKMRECLAHHDFDRFSLLKPKLLEVVDKMLADDIAKLMAMIPHEEMATMSDSLVKGTFFIYSFHTRYEKFYRIPKKKIACVCLAVLFIATH